MGLLFGMPEEEVQAIAEEQKSKIQKLKDESALFGDVNVEEFSAQYDQLKAEVQNEHIMEPENEEIEPEVEEIVEQIEEFEQSFELDVVEVAEPELTAQEKEYNIRQQELN